MHLIGLDIGFSSTQRTNAMAELQNGELRVVKLSVSERDAALQRLRDVDVIAIDAPIVPSHCSAETPRLVEQLFSRGVFQKRCKPGASHVRGTGHLLREHGVRAAAAVAQASHWETDPPFPTVFPRCGVAEAFPNAFLGVALPDEIYDARPKLPRGAKFDWLYNHWIERDLFSQAVMRCGLPLELTTTLHTERDHEKRAALVCLLTAAFAATGRAVAIGDAHTGYFFLPAVELWASWSREALLDRLR
jgi:predicted RNase H-like nuclease